MLHHRQFVLADPHYTAPEGWNALEVDYEVVLYHCPELHVREVRDSGGILRFLVGDCVQGEAGKESPEAQIASLMNTKDIIERSYTWAGRWALISGAEVFSDAGALLGIYFPEHNESQGVYCSSSLSLVALYHDATRRTPRQLGWYGMNWFPPPLTAYSGVRKLLPDQVLRFVAGRAVHAERLYPDRVEGMSLGERVELIGEGIRYQFRSYAERYERFYLALTAGLDSRTSMALLEPYADRVHAYTMEHPNISEADVQIPPELAKRRGLSHRFIESQSPQSELEREFDLHTAYSVVDADRYFLTRDMFREIPGQTLLVRSGGWEIGRNFYYHKLKGLEFNRICKEAQHIPWRLGTFGNIQSSAQELTLWLEWRARHLSPYDWRDMFYLDQRMGGWLSTIEQALDQIVGVHSVHPCNCAMYFDVLLSVSETQRDAAVIQRELLKRYVPDFESIPINPKDESPWRSLQADVLHYSKALLGEVRNMILQRV